MRRRAADALFRNAGSAALGLACALLISSAVYGDGDPEQGSLEFVQCYACHSIGEDSSTIDPKGPDIAGIVGAPIAADEDFPYSDAMREFAEEHGTWTEDLLDEFIAWPTKVVPGTSMDVTGLNPEEKRRDLIAYLKAKSE